MKKWEHKYVPFGVNQPIKDAISYSNEIGQEGWEMCGVVKFNGVPCYLFKREIT